MNPPPRRRGRATPCCAPIAVHTYTFTDRPNGASAGHRPRARLTWAVDSSGWSGAPRAPQRRCCGCFRGRSMVVMRSLSSAICVS